MGYPTVVLIVADALRCDKLGCYGNKKGLTPNIDKLASEGILFKICYSSSTWTFPAVASLFTSYLPDVHLLKEVVPDESGMLTSDVLAPSFLTLAEILKNNGFETLSVVANPWLRDFFQVTRGFKKRIYEKKVDAKRINELFFSNIFKRKDFPAFYYLHYMDCHAPFNLRLSEELREKYRDLIDKLEFPLKYRHFKRNFNSLSRKEIEFLNDVYEGEVRYLDSFLGEIFEHFKDSIVIFTSDHGEFLGERDYHPLIKDRVIAFGHNKTPYEELIRVPLIIKIPEFKGREVEKIVHHVDVLPTILEYLGISVNEDFQGKSLLPIAKGERVEDSHFDISFSVKHEGRYIPFVERCVVIGNEKLIQYLKPEREQIVPFGENSFNSINYNFGGYFTLIGYVINKKSFKRGEYGWIKLYIRCEREIPLKNAFFMLLFTDEKDLSVPFINKHYPMGGLRCVGDWKKGEVFEDLFTFFIPRDIKGGNYYLKMGLYNLDGEKEGVDAEENFLGGAKIFGKIFIDKEYEEKYSLKTFKNIFKKVFFSIWGYLASFLVLGKKNSYKRGEIALVKCRLKSLFEREIRYVQFKFFNNIKGFKDFNPDIFIWSRGFAERDRWFSLLDNVFPLLIPPYLKDGTYDLKVNVLPKVLKKPKWDFLYFKMEDIVVDGEIDEVIDEFMIFCGINLKNISFKVGKSVDGELLLKVFNRCNKKINLKCLMLDEKGDVVLNGEYSFDLLVEDVPYYGYVIKAFPFSMEVPEGLKSGGYEFVINLNGKRIKCYRVWMLSDVPELEVLREEFYDLRQKEVRERDVIKKIDGKKLEKFRSIIDEMYRKSYMLRESKIGGKGNKKVFHDKVAKELKDLGYF